MAIHKHDNQALLDLYSGIADMDLAFSEGMNGPLQISVDSTDLHDVAAFQPAETQDVVFRIPAGYTTGITLSMCYQTHGAVPSAAIKLQLEYKIVDAGGPAEGGVLKTITTVISPVPAVDVNTRRDLFVIPVSDITDVNSCVNCRLFRMGTDAGDGYPGEWRLLNISPRRT